MCKWGTTKNLLVKTSPGFGYKQKAIDKCIYNIVKSLNAGGVITTGSCCGHDKEDGSILLDDGRELIIKKKDPPFAKIRIPSGR